MVVVKVEVETFYVPHVPHVPHVVGSLSLASSSGHLHYRDGKFD